jgi:uncharacterized protein (DUF2147 family)
MKVHQSIGILALAIASLSRAASASEPKLAEAIPLNASPESIVGEWGDAEIRVRVSRSADKYVARIVWMKEPNGPDGKPLLDSKNPDEKLRNRPILGIAVFYNMAIDGDELKGGVAYDYESGKFYNCKAWLEDNDTLKIRGYAGISLLGQTVALKRIKK